MCRLFGYVAVRPVSTVALLGQDSFDAFTSLTAVHSDGWGMAWRDAGGGSVHVAKSPDSAADDARYFELTESALGTSGIVHLRWATGGLAVAQPNTHPFAEGGYAFAHNGNIAPRDRLELLLSAASRDKLEGETDSERYFRFVMQCIEEDEDESAGLTRAVGVLHEIFHDCSLNALLLTPTRLFAVHFNSDAASPARALNEIFADDLREIPFGHEHDYFAMSYRVTSDAVCVISSGLDEEGWSAMGPDTVVAIDLASRAATPLPLTRPASSRRDAR